MSKWARVKKSEPCQICGKPDFCTRAIDGSAIRCTRVESERPSADKNGGVAWLHSLDNPLPPLPPPKEIEKKADWTRECKAMFDHKSAQRKRCDLATVLSVSVESLELLRVGIGWDWDGGEFSSWPSRDNTGRCVGFIRRYHCGSKKSNLGGTTGVFYSPTTWYKHPGPVLIVEGGSDVAACELNKLCAIGRASNTCGGYWIKRMIEKQCSEKRIIVVGERDENPSRRGSPTVPSCPSNCKGCSLCWPGLFGMQKVASDLGDKAVGVMVPPGCKDMRELLSKGGLWLDLMKVF